MSLLAVAWDWYARNREALTAAGAMLGGGLLAWGALQQPAFAPHRLREQNDKNRLPSVTEVFSKAVEHIGSNKAQVCLGGIYTLERISRESRHDYGAVMEILTAFIRYRARWNEPEAAPPLAQPYLAGRRRRSKGDLAKTTGGHHCRAGGHHAARTC